MKQMKNKLLKKVNIILFSLLIAIIFVSNSNFVKAQDNKDLLDSENKWSGKFTSPAAGTVTSDSSDGFIANMTSIGGGIGSTDFDAIAYLSNITLEASKTYVYSAKITSDSLNRNLYVGINKGTNFETGILAGDYGVIVNNTTASRTTLIFKPTTTITNATIVYRLSLNGYESLDVGAKNQITVTDSKLMLYDDYIDYIAKDYNLDDLRELNYTKIPTYKPTDNVSYDNYLYTSEYNFLVQNDQKVSSNQTIYTISFPSLGVVGTIRAVYLNGEKITPDNLTDNDISEDSAIRDGEWVHVPYKLLENDYNYITLIGDNAASASVIIKNDNIATPKEEKMSQIESLIQKISNQKLIKELKDLLNELENKSTIDEINAISIPTEQDILLKDAKYNALDEINTYKNDDNSHEITLLIEKAKNNINNATTIDEVTNIKKLSISDISLQLIKEKNIANLEKELGEKYSDEVKAIYEKAKDDINKANTEDEIEEILAKAKNDIKNQTEKEKISNPSTIDNIYVYITVFIVGIFSSIYLLKKQKNIVIKK